MPFPAPPPHPAYNSSRRTQTPTGKPQVRNDECRDRSGLPVRRLPRLTTILCSTLALALAGCAARPLKGGKAITSPNPAGGLEQTILQGENPSQPTRQTQDTLKVRTYTLPPASRTEPPAATTSGTGPIPSYSSHSQNSAAPPPTAPHPPEPFIITEREETHATTELGAAQKDTARELGAKLSSLKGIVWVGLGLFIFGLASLFWPPLKLAIGSITTSAAITVGGLALIILPTLIVGNELFILGAVAVAVGGWFLAHRHGHLRGQLSATAPQSPAAPDLAAPAPAFPLPRTPSIPRS